MISSSAFLSGACAAFASIFGKLCGLDYAHLDHMIKYLIKISCFLIMILFNVLMWRFFVRALHSSKSSMEATILSTATNYILSGIFAYAVFGEITGLMWWSGVTLIIIGIVIINQSPQSKSA